MHLGHNGLRRREFEGANTLIRPHRTCKTTFVERGWKVVVVYQR